MAAAAYYVLVDLFPKQAERFETELASSLAAIPDGPREQIGYRLGEQVAQLVLAARHDDGWIRRWTTP